MGWPCSWTHLTLSTPATHALPSRGSSHGPPNPKVSTLERYALHKWVSGMHLMLSTWVASKWHQHVAPTFHTSHFMLQLTLGPLRNWWIEKALFGHFPQVKLIISFPCLTSYDFFDISMGKTPRHDWNGLHTLISRWFCKAFLKFTNLYFFSLMMREYMQYGALKPFSPYLFIHTTHKSEVLGALPCTLPYL